MVICRVSCLDLRPNEDERKKIYERITKATGDPSVENLQRTLIVLQNLRDNQLVKSYSAITYFYPNRSDIRFFRERKIKWDPKIVSNKLKRSKSKIEVLVDVDPIKLEVVLNNQTSLRDLKEVGNGGGYEKQEESSEDPEESMQFEKYLLRFGAFQKSIKERALSKNS